MNFSNLKNAYKDLQNLMHKYKNSPARLDVGDLMLLCKAFDALKEVNDHTALLHVYDVLRHGGNLAYPPRHDPRNLHLYMLWLQAQLKIVGYEQGTRLLAQALEWFPAYEPLVELQIFYLWYHDQKHLDGRILSGDFPDPVPEMLLTLYGEHLIRMGAAEQARSLAFLANVDPRRRQDLALLMVNAARDPEQKMHWFNSFLAAQNMEVLSRIAPEKGFGIDNLTGAGTPRHWPGDQPLVSVIITAYECPDFLETSVGSILKQSYQNLEVLIVDDCSSAPTREKIRDLAARDARITPIYRSENGGTYIAKSAAMGRARGDYVIFHDADDWAHPDKIWQEVSALQSQEELVCRVSGWARMDQHGDFVMQLSGKYAHPNPAGTLLRHPLVYNRLGGFDDVRTGADSAYKRRIQQEFGARSLRTDPSVLVLGRHHSGSLTQGGVASMGNFGWSPVRALYRGNWLDAMVAGASKSWAPLGMRKRPIKIGYDARDVAVFDPLKRLGLDQQFQDFLLIIQGKLSKRHLTQIHRLVMGLNQSGYRVGVYFEDQDWAKDTWQAQHFERLKHIRCYPDLRLIRAKICLLITGDDQANTLQLLSRDLVHVDQGTHARALAPARDLQPMPVFLLSPNIEAHLADLAAVPRGQILALVRGNDTDTPALKGNPFALVTLTDQTGKYGNALVLSGPGWSDENRIEVAMLARYLGRECLHSQAKLTDIPQIKDAVLQAPPEGKQAFLPLTLSTGAPAQTGAAFVQEFAARLSEHLGRQKELNLGLTLELPATGL